MELAVSIAAILGVILFIATYLKFVVSGFKHHPVTGIIAIFPVINLLVLPSLWHRTGRALIVGFFGLLLVLGAWFLGAEKSMSKYLQLLMGKEQGMQVIDVTEPSTSQLLIPGSPGQSTSTASSPTVTSMNSLTTVESEKVIRSTSEVKDALAMRDESDMQILPGKALYKMGFEAMPVAGISRLTGRIVRIVDNNHVLFEGRITRLTASSVFLKLTGQNTAEVEIPISNIKKLSLMVKKPQ